MLTPYSSSRVYLLRKAFQRALAQIAPRSILLLRGWLAFAALWAATGVCDSAWAAASEPGVSGRWCTIDEHTGTRVSLVRLTQHGDEVVGTVERVLASNHGGHPICTRCEGARKNQPIEGLTFMWGLRPSPRDPRFWTGGTVLDPKSGREYRCNVRLLPSGELEVRGYIGFSVLGRTQRWRRAAADQPALTP